METRANYAMIGAFTLSVIAAAFMFIYWFSGGRSKQGEKVYEVVFSSSVSGLSRGAQVKFNGLRVGEVSRIELMPSDPSKVRAIIEVDPLTPVNADTKARLEFQGLTGIASIALSGGASGATPLNGTVAKLASITAESSDFQNVLEMVQKIASRADGTLARIEKIIADNEASVSRTIRNAETFSNALAENADGVKAFMNSIATLGKTIEPVVANLQELTKNVNARVAAIDIEQVKSLMASATKTFSEIEKFVGANSLSLSASFKNIEDVTKTLADNREGIKQFIASVSTIGKSIEPAVASFEKVIKDIGVRVEAVTPEQIKSISANTDKLIATLRGSADKIDGVLTGIEKLLGSGDTNSVIAEISEAAKAFRNLSNNLDKRTRELTVSIRQFTGPGLRQYEALAQEGRKTLEQINRAVRSMEKNPQQFIFGAKPSIPEYSGR